MSVSRVDSGVRSRCGSAALLLCLVLSACRTAPPPPPPPADIVVAGTDPAVAVASFGLVPGESKNYELRVPAGVAQASDVIYLELDPSQNGVLELRGATYWHVIASSASPDRFVSGILPGVPQPSPGSTSAGSGDARAILENRACLGPCVIFEPTTTTYYARILNDTGSIMSADLYLYGYGLQDSFEPQNDSRSTAPVLGSSNAGALEVIGDTDFWLAPGHVQATVTKVVGGVDTVAVVVDAGGVVVDGPYASGEPFEVFTGEYVRVRAATGTAAPPAKSTYFVETTTLPGNPTRPPTYLEVSANNSGAALDQGTVPAGGMVEYRVSIPATVRSRAVLYVELDTNLGLELRSASNLSSIASSSSPNSFSSGGSFVVQQEAAGAALGQAISASKSCGGSCVIIVPNSNSYFVRVYGGSSSSAFTLYAYGYDLMDDTEPANDSTGSAPVLVTDVSGAVETIPDADAWRMATSGTVAFDTVSGGPALQARLLDAGGVPIPVNLGGGPYVDGQSFSVFSGEYIVISAVNGNEAAVAARSTYFLERTGAMVSGARAGDR